MARPDRPESPESPANPDRRSAHPFNRLRRFLNNYWLVPVVVIYLQLLTALLNVHGTGEHGLLARNRLFFQGIPLTFEILAYDFPYAVIGHGKELTYHWGGAGLAMAPAEVSDDVHPMDAEIYRAILASQARHDTEVGGIVMLAPDGRIVLHPVPSSNGDLVRTLKALTPEAAIAELRKPVNRPIVNALAASVGPIDRISKLLDDPKVVPAQRERAFSALLYSIEVVSESRYVLLPMVFKATLGRLPEWRLVGMYHFHNEVDVPPSLADVAASADMRQLVFVLEPDGFNLYDLYQGHATVTHHEATPELPGPGAPRRA
jgi:hypothetical protein